MDYGFQYDRFFDPKHRSIDSNKTLRILNVGSFQHKKNQNFIIDIALALKQKLNTFEIHLLGQGELYEAVKTRIKNHQLEDHIKLHGVVYNVHDWYKVSDIYIHTAYYEPFGLVFLEAMASGLPVVCLDGKGNRDIMEDGKNGYIIDEQNADTFAEWIYNLYTDQNLYSQISIYAQTFAKRFDIKLKIKEFVEFYTSIIGK
jgi:glycosyltransferase involved in cell wall biosynthesis